PGWSTNLYLFVIQRNKNTNEVQYELRVNDRCQIGTAYPVAAVWRLREVSPEQTEALSDLEQMIYGATNQQVTAHGVSFDLGVLEFYRPLDLRRFIVTGYYDPKTATCTTASRLPFMGRRRPWSAFMCRPTNGWAAPSCGISMSSGKVWRPLPPQSLNGSSRKGSWINCVDRSRACAGIWVPS